MAYTPNPEDATRPILSDPPSTLPEELRGIKGRMNSINSSKMDKVFPVLRAVPSGENNLTATGSVSINLANGSFFRYTLTGNVTFSFTHPAVANNELPSFILRLAQSGNFTVTWPNVRWELGIVPERTLNGIDVFLFYKPTPNSSYWEGKLAMRDVRA